MVTKRGTFTVEQQLTAPVRTCRIIFTEWINDALECEYSRTQRLFAEAWYSMAALHQEHAVTRSQKTDKLPSNKRSQSPLNPSSIFTQLDS
ncbi:hypothetical protein NUW54_g9104 [Trametes sanguinea]|uniref:Uncharacterized protein n=1 Tax=Trametes sanguinea TaxID=158606 RepID=A0ACC1P8J1_9APHY|nr:hypothetical protein NUW54_g9104 [Trametes sanguinea]